MRRVTASQLKVGMVLGRPVFDGKGRLLLSAPLDLDDRTIERIARLGIDSVWIDDPRLAGLEVEEVVSEHLRRAAAEFFSTWRAALEAGRPVPCVDQDGVRRLVSDLQQELPDLSSRPVAVIPGPADAERYLVVQALNGARLALALAPQVGLGRYAIDIAAAAFVRDVALLALEPGMRAPGGEDPAERQHPSASLACLQHAALWSPLTKVAIAQHHERLDGSGYPARLIGGDIHQAGGLLGVIDAYLSLVVPYPGLEVTAPEQALDFVLGSAAFTLDAKVVRALCGSVGLYPAGAIVRLSNGEEAVVVDGGRGTHRRPRVRLLPEGCTLDLQDPGHLALQVVGVVEA